MSPQDKQLLADLQRRVTQLERAENVSALKMFERNSTFVTQADIDALTLTDLADVDTTGVSNGQVIKYSSGEWLPANDIDT